jgi:hypothetical protein
VGGHAYSKADYETAGKLHAKGKMTVEGIEKRSELSTRRAYRIYKQFQEGAVVYDHIGLRPGPATDGTRPSVTTTRLGSG